MLEMTAGGFSFTARFEEDAAPETVAAFRRMLPLDSKIIHVRWSGEGGWIPMGDLDVGIGPENATRYPSPGELIFYPGGVSETEASCLRTATSRSRAKRAPSREITSRRSSRAKRTCASSAGGCSGTAPRRSLSGRASRALQRIREDVDRERDVVVGGELVPGVAHAAVQAAHEEHRRVDTRRGEDSGVVARARGKVHDLQVMRGDRLARGLGRVTGEPHRLDAVVGLEPDSGDQGVELAGVGGPNVETQPHS